MARITCKQPANLTGHVGPVPFTNGHGETDDPDLLAHFASDPDRFTVTDEGDDTDPHTLVLDPEELADLADALADFDPLADPEDDPTD